MATEPSVLDPAQLKRIESVHRGFLYQHLYSAGCLLLVAGTDASHIVVEADEDIEIVYPDRRLYLQVKTRSEPLTESDIGAAIKRFAQLRKEHADGTRLGTPAFAIVANIQPGPKLAEQINGKDWPVDIVLHWPDNDLAHQGLPVAWRDVTEGLASCAAIAAGLPFERWCRRPSFGS